MNTDDDDDDDDCKWRETCPFTLNSTSLLLLYSERIFNFYNTAVAIVLSAIEAILSILGDNVFRELDKNRFV